MRFLTSILVLSVTLPAAATTYYIDAATGSDSYSGLSLSTAWATINKANTTLVAGDTVYIRAGTYNQIINPTNSGTAGSPITYRNYSSDVVTVRGVSGQIAVAYLQASYITLDGLTLKHVNPASVADPRIVLIYGDSYDHNTIRNCTIICQGTGTYDGGDEFGIQVSYGDYTTIENNTVTGWPVLGINVALGATYTVIRGNTVTNTLNSAIDFSAQGYGAHYGLVENNFIDYTYQEDGIQFEGNYNLPPEETDYDSNQKVVIRNNVIRYCAENGIDLKGGGPMLIEGNIIYGCTADNEGPGNGFDRFPGAGTIMHGSDEGSRDVIVRGNILYDNQGGIHCENGYQVYNNTVVYNNRDYTGSSSSWVSTYRPTFAGLEGWGGRTNVNLKNNILGGHSSADVAIAQTAPDLTIQGNLYFPAGGALLVHFIGTNNWHTETWANWPGQLASPILALGCDTASFNANPLLVNLPVNPAGVHTLYDFTLQPTSPCIDAGQFLTTTNGAGSGTSMVVADSRYFCDGYGIVTGDTIQLQGQTATAHVTVVNYTTHTLTLDAALTWTSGQGVALAYSGSKPDIGAKEYTSFAGWALTVGGSHVTVTKNPDKSLYGQNEVVTLTAVADSGYVFSEWTGDLTGSENPKNITMNASKSVTANVVATGAGTYYVDAQAAEGGNGISPSTAWNQLSDIPGLAAGSTVLLQRGDTWREPLLVTSSGSQASHIKIGAYGSGGNPLLKGTALLSSGWTQEGGTGSDWTETDPTGVLAVTSHQVTWTNLTRATDTWFYKTDTFNGDFTQKFEVQFAAGATASARAVPWMLANFVDSYSDHLTALETNDAMLLLYLNSAGTYQVGLYFIEDGSMTGPANVTLAADTLYCVTVTRDDDAGANATGQVVVEIHTGDYHPAGTHVATLTKDCAAGEQNDFQYLYAIAAKNDTYGNTCSGFVQNVDLGGGAALWTETDPQSTITVATNQVSWTALTKQATAHVVRDMGAGHFAGDFVHKFRTMADDGSGSAWAYCWVLMNEINTPYLLEGTAQEEDDYIGVYLYGAGTEMRLRKCEDGVAATDGVFTLSLDTVYYVTVSRDDDAGVNATGRYTWHVHTGDYHPNGVHVHEGTLDCGVGEQNDFRYAYAVASYNNGAGYTHTGYTNNLDFGEGGGIEDFTTAPGTIEEFLGDATSVWKASLATEPTQMFFNAARGTLETSVGTIDAMYEWYWSAGLLYVYSASNPATAFTAPGVEASLYPNSRVTGLLQVTSPWVDIENIDVTQSYGRGICLKSTGGTQAANVTVTGCAVTWSKDSGIVGPATEPLVSNVTIADCQVAYNNTGYLESDTGHEAVTMQNVSGFTLRCNNVHDNFLAGINAKYGSTNGLIYQNLCHDNGQPGVAGQIHLDGATQTDVYQNLIYGGNAAPKKDVVDGVSLVIEQDAWPTTGIRLWGNVIRDCSSGIHFSTGASVTADLTEIRVFNNTVASCPTAAIRFAATVANNAASPLLVTNNILWQDAGYAVLDDTPTQQIITGVATVSYNGFAAGQQTETYGTYSLSTATPRFADTVTNDYSLLSDSPFVNAGVTLGSPFDVGLSSLSSWPSGVATLDQDAYGAAWELGAYVCPPTTQYEDLLTYTESYDLDSTMTVTSTRVTGSCDNDNGTVLWKDFGQWHFGADLTLRWAWYGNPGGTWTAGQHGYTGMADEVGCFNTVTGSPTSHSVWVDYTTTGAVLRVYDGMTQEASDSTNLLTMATLYYMELKRTNGTGWQLHIWTGGYEQTLVAALAVTATTTPAYRYMVPWSGRSDGSAGSRSNWYLENLSLGGGAGGAAVTPILMHHYRQRR